MVNSGNNNSDNPSSLDAQPPGDRLRKAREACGLSREEVANHLNLSVEKIESLEKGDVESIAAPVFVAGYLRSYARLVNLSGDEIIADFKSLASMSSPSMDPASSPATNNYGQVGKASSFNMSLSGRSHAGKTIIWGALAVILTVGGYVYLTGDEEVAPDNTAEIKSENNKDNIDFIDSSIKPSLGEPKDTKQEKPVKEETPITPAPINTTVNSSKPLISTPNKIAKPEGDTSSEEFSHLALYFTEESWVEVNDSRDKRFLYQIGKAGTSHTVAGLAPFNVHLGYVRGVNIMYNGRTYDLSRFSNRKSVRFQIGELGDRMKWEN